MRDAGDIWQLRSYVGIRIFFWCGDGALHTPDKRSLTAVFPPIGLELDVTRNSTSKWALAVLALRMVRGNTFVLY